MWFEQFRRRRKIDQMARDLGVTLRQQYGAKRHYRPADVDASGAALGLSGALLGYGLALYCTREDFEHFNHGLFGAIDYDQLRGEFDAPERYSQLSSDSGPRQPEATDAFGGAGEISDASDSGGGVGNADSGDAGGGGDGGTGGDGGGGGGGGSGE